MKRHWCKRLSCLVVALACLDARAGAETNAVPQLPKWELGVVAGAARIPHYRGAEEYKWYVVPLPYFVYRGERVQADREGIRGLFYKGPRVETDISLGGNPPVKDGTGAREGMPDLDPLVELGPAARLFLYKGRVVSSIALQASARGVCSFDRDDLGPGYVGLRGDLALILGSFIPSRGSPWRMGARADVDFGDQDYHRYFYDVDPVYVLPGRPEYHSEPGYGGCSVSAFVVRKLFDGVSVSAYGKWINIEGAVYEDSPLVREHDNFIFGTALTWRFAESKVRVRPR